MIVGLQSTISRGFFYKTLLTISWVIWDCYSVGKDIREIHRIPAVSTSHELVR